MGLEIKNPDMLNTLEETLFNVISLNIPLGFFTLSILAVAVFFIIFHYLNKKITPGAVLFPGLFVGKDNRLSISKFQGVLWTLVAIVSYMTLKLISTYCLVPMEATIPPNLLVLMGLNYTTLVLAKGITGYSVNKGSIKTKSSRTSLTDLFRTDDDNKTDLMKFQMLCWTLVALVVYFANFFAQFNGDVSIIRFPDVDNSLLYLMLIGQGAYLGDKAIHLNKPKITNVTPLVIDPGEPFSISGLFVENETTFTVNKNMTLDILGWNTLPDGLASAKVSIPAGTKLVSTPLEIIATTQGVITEPFFVNIKI